MTMKWINPFRAASAGNRRMRRAMLAAGVVVLGGLLATGVQAVMHPSALSLSLAVARAPGGEIHGVPYEKGARHSMDIFLPKPTGTAPPVVVFFYGGAWRAGDRQQYRFVGRSLAACGVMAVIPDYRVWPEVKFPGFLDDGAAAVAGALEAARRLGGDTGRLFLMGHSAGAYIATMLGLDPTWLGREGLSPDQAISGVIGLSGVYDFLPFNKRAHAEIFAPFGATTQPVTFADHVAPPMLLMAGKRDTVVDPANTRSLAAHLEAAGTPVRSVMVKKARHADLVLAFAWPKRAREPVLSDSCDFIHGRAAPDGIPVQ
jgi:acetyl esterase/lipase